MTNEVELDFPLHPKQLEAFFSQATEILYGGAAGGGKSHFLRVAAIAFAYLIPGLQVYLFRRLSPDLLKNHMEGPTSFPVLLAEWVDMGFAKINYTENSIAFRNGKNNGFAGGSKIFLCHCQYEKNMYSYQGAEIHLLLFDELTHFTDKIYRYLRGRLRLGGLKVPEEYQGIFPRVISGANPGGVGHNWVKASFVDGCDPMEHRRMEKEEGGMLRQYIPAKLTDNPTLMENDPDYADRLSALGSPELVKAMLEGDWDIISGGMFDDVFSRDVHVIKPFRPPKTWKINRSFDWGSSKPFAVGWWAESDGTEATMTDGTKRIFPPGTLFRIFEWYGWDGKTPDKGIKMSAKEIAKGIKEREAKFSFKVMPGPADSSIWTEENKNCINDDFESEDVYWQKANKKPGSRINGWEKMRGMFKACFEFPMEEPGLFVFSNCFQFIRTIPTLPRDETKHDDVNTHAEDHIGDETRYRVLETSVTTGRDLS
ncbi:phage terminase large subunit [Pseudodesulfovibrio nedwellii]|uniref:Phage terminase large subunit n=1 Tax=Pseudodesulfovibrio nedwellii TaxID=2973072 RepID=A0ABN6RZ88_9BACT|nr:terminase family protein [Pseudodesulfovibrio nedwellii]BDQ36312.1 phage terminase large subunit [Pseudodesulfovibrio nedwellii]